MQSAKNKVTKPAQGFSDEERAAMKERALELKATTSRAAGEKAVLTKIAAMSESDRSIAKRLHTIITQTVPWLTPKTWYGMPAYANQEGKVVCFFQSADKFKTRYATLGFQHDAHLDDGVMWPVAFALTKLSAAEEKIIITLVKKAVS